jgi:hypothetical protein
MTRQPAPQAGSGRQQGRPDQDHPGPRLPVHHVTPACVSSTSKSLRRSGS